MAEAAPVILVVDDDQVVHASIKRILSRLNFQVEGVLTAPEALRLMEAGRYDAVIADLMMPKMNGLELLETMRRRGLRIPTIMITGYPTIKTAVMALRLGAADYIPKPFTRQELLSPLNRALRVDHEAGSGLGQDIAPGRREVEITLSPGDRFFLPGHSWAVYNPDGTMSLGVEAGFLATIPPLEEIEAPVENHLIEQGYTGLKLMAAGEVHSVFMPLSGRVTAVNTAAVEKPGELTAETWILRFLPSRLNEELPYIDRSSPGSKRTSPK